MLNASISVIHGPPIRVRWLPCRPSSMDSSATAMTATIASVPASLTAIPAGARVELEASWPAASAETFAYFDPVSQTLTTQREAMQVAWYTSAGSLDTESTGRASGDMSTTTDDGWDAPGTTGTVHVWIVLRDSRGGVDFAETDVTVVAP